jgi:hypothetical protein
MLKSVLIGIAALAVIAGAATAQGKMDCGALYKTAIEKFHREKAAGLPAERIANANRIALRAFDACSAGDEFNAATYFQQLEDESP